MDIGGRIKELRLKKKMTQKELAKQTNLAEITIRQYESGKREPRMEQLQKIANALDVHILVLLGQISEKMSDSIKHSVDISAAFIELFRFIYGEVDLSPKPYDDTWILGEDHNIRLSDLDFDNITEAIESLIIQSVKHYASYSGEEPSLASDYVLPDVYIDYTDLLLNYKRLNKYGRLEAVKRVQELTEIPKYTDYTEED